MAPISMLSGTSTTILQRTNAATGTFCRLSKQPSVPGNRHSMPDSTDDLYTRTETVCTSKALGVFLVYHWCRVSASPISCEQPITDHMFRTFFVGILRAVFTMLIYQAGPKIWVGVPSKPLPKFLQNYNGPRLYVCEMLIGASLSCLIPLSPVFQSLYSKIIQGKRTNRSKSFQARGNN